MDRRVQIFSFGNRRDFLVRLDQPVGIFWRSSSWLFFFHEKCLLNLIHFSVSRQCSLSLIHHNVYFFWEFETFRWYFNILNFWEKILRLIESGNILQLFFYYRKKKSFSYFPQRISKISSSQVYLSCEISTPKFSIKDVPSIATITKKNCESAKFY